MQSLYMKLYLIGHNTHCSNCFTHFNYFLTSMYIVYLLYLKRTNFQSNTYQVIISFI